MCEFWVKNGNYKTKLPNYIKIKDEDLIFSFYVRPNSKKNEICFDQYNLIAYSKAPPSKGKANKSILSTFANFLEIPQSSIVLISGQKARKKIIRIYNCDKPKQYKILCKFRNFN